VAVVVTAAFLASSAAAMAGHARAAAAEASATAQSPAPIGPERYFVDLVLRSTSPAADAADAALRAEVTLIFANGLRQGALPSADKEYLARVVAARTGVTEPVAERRVDDAFAQDQKAADAARKSFAHSMYWTFLALLVGAFSASFAATIGGKQRDRVIVI
jgi:hypothetical protein